MYRAKYWAKITQVAQNPEGPAPMAGEALGYAQMRTEDDGQDRAVYRGMADPADPRTVRSLCPYKWFVKLATEEAPKDMVLVYTVTKV
jgi:hypothetical protein